MSSSYVLDAVGYNPCLLRCFTYHHGDPHTRVKATCILGESEGRTGTLVVGPVYAAGTWPESEAPWLLFILPQAVSLPPSLCHEEGPDGNTAVCRAALCLQLPVLLTSSSLSL